MSKRLTPLALAMVAFAACAGRAATPTTTNPSSEAVPCPKVQVAEQAPAAGPGDGPLSLAEVANVPFRDHVSSLALWDGHLAYTHADKSVVVCRLPRGEQTRVANVPAGSEEVITYVAGSGQTVVYTRFGEMPSTASSTDWQIASRGVAPDAPPERTWAAGRASAVDLPQPVIDWPWLAWREANGGSLEERATDTAVWAVDLRTAAKRKIAANPQIGGVALADGMVFFDAATADPEQRELYRAAADGSSPPVQLTHQGGVERPTAANKRLVWRTKVGDADQRWTMTVDSSSPMAIPPGETAPVPGPDYLFTGFGDSLGILDVKHLDAGPLALPGPNEHESADPLAWWAIDGSYFAWVTIDDPLAARSARHLHLGRASRG